VNHFTFSVFPDGLYFLVQISGQTISSSEVSFIHRPLALLPQDAEGTEILFLFLFAEWGEKEKIQALRAGFVCERIAGGMMVFVCRRLSDKRKMKDLSAFFAPLR